MFLFNTFYALREEALKSWEYNFSNILMQFRESFDANTIPDNAMSQRKIIRHLRGRWWEILIQHRNGDFYCVLIEPILRFHRAKVNRNHCCVDGDNSMLVGVRQLVQHPQTVEFRVFPLRCIVRLKLLNDLSGVIGEMLQESIKFPPHVIFGNRQKNGELDIGFPVFRTVTNGGKQHQLPSDVVKSGAEIMNSITRYDSNIDRDSFSLKSIDIGRLFRIEMFSDNRERFTVVPSADSILERLYMYRRPIELAPWPVEWVHMLCHYKETKRYVSTTSEQNRIEI
jgi:hypothetical protein